MKVKIKVLIVAIISAVMLFGILSGCEKKHGEFYTLQQAYDNGYLTIEDLERIASYTNNDISCPEPLDSRIEKQIKNDMAYEVRHAAIEPVKEAKPKDIEIVTYYGEYSGSYFVRLRIRVRIYFTYEPSSWLNIGGVEIHIVGQGPFYIWRKN